MYAINASFVNLLAVNCSLLGYYLASVVRNSQYWLRNNPKNSSLQLLRCGRVKSCLLAVISLIKVMKRGDSRKKRWVKEFKTSRCDTTGWHARLLVLRYKSLSQGECTSAAWGLLKCLYPIHSYKSHPLVPLISNLWHTTSTHTWVTNKLHCKNPLFTHFTLQVIAIYIHV